MSVQTLPARWRALLILDLTRVRAGPTAVSTAGRLGRQCRQGRAARTSRCRRGSRGARHGPELPEPAPQQARHHDRTSSRRREQQLFAASRPRPTWWWRTSPRREDPARHRLSRSQQDQSAPPSMPAIRFRPRMGLNRERPGRRPDRAGLGGLMSITGEVDGPDARPASPSPIFPRPLLCARHHGGRCWRREQSGKGQQVETSLLQAQIFMLDFQASRWLNAGEVPKQAGNNHPTSIRPECSKRATATLTSPPPAGRCGSGSCKRSTPPHCWTIRSNATGPAG